MSLLEGKKLLLTGVVTRKSIAYAVAERAQEAGAEIVLTSFGRARRMTERAAAKLPDPPDVLELDVNKQEDFEALGKELESRWGGLDGALHAIAFAPEDALGGKFMSAPPESARAGVPDQRVLAQVAGRDGHAAAGQERRRRDRRAGLRRLGRLARLRLDGRREGRAGVRLPLPGSRPGPAGRAGQPGVGRAGRDAGRRRDPGLRRARGRWGSRRRSAGTRRPRPGRRRRLFLLSDWARGITARSSMSTAASTRWAALEPVNPPPNQADDNPGHAARDRRREHPDARRHVPRRRACRALALRHRQAATADQIATMLSGLLRLRDLHLRRGRRRDRLVGRAAAQPTSSSSRSATSRAAPVVGPRPQDRHADPHGQPARGRRRPHRQRRRRLRQSAAPASPSTSARRSTTTSSRRRASTSAA